MARKKKERNLFEELSKGTPVFVPPISFGPNVDAYSGKLALHPLVKFNVSANRQSQGFYVVSGTISLDSPKDGYLLQPSADRLAMINADRSRRGLKVITSSHSYATAATRELNVGKMSELPFPANAPENKETIFINPIDYTDMLTNEALYKANMILLDYEKDLSMQLSFGVNISKMPLGLLLHLFGSAYLDTRTDIDTQKVKYRNLIEVVSNAAGLIPIGKLTEEKLLDLVERYPIIKPHYLEEVYLFADYVALYRGLDNPLGTVIPSVIHHMPKLRDIPRLCDIATNPVSLTEEVEDNLNKRLWGNFDPLAAGLVLIKEGHLNAEEVCNATFAMLDYSPADPTRLFFLLRKDKYSGATHDYRFPLLPFGAHYFAEYINHLRTKYGDSRVDAEKYILSDSDDGSTPISVDALKQFATTETRKIPFGYAALAGIKPSRTPKAITLLHNTYAKRLEEGCRLHNDHGAIMFLTHKSLAHSVQTDCYRGLTDKTGMDYLYRSTLRDQRGIPPAPKEKRIRSTRMDKENHRKITRYPSDVNGFASSSTISLKGLKAGDIVTITAEHGCFVSVLPPK